MKREGKLVVISGPSGVGKSTVCAELLKSPRFERVVTCTTRAPRDGEQDGVHYRFLSRLEFERGIRDGMFLEHAEVHSHYYGTPRRETEEALGRGRLVLLNIDVQGAAQLRGNAGMKDNLVTVFLLPPDAATLAARLMGRGSEDPREVNARLRTAEREMLEQDHYDHKVVNGDLKETVEEILDLVGANH